MKIRIFIGKYAKYINKRCNIKQLKKKKDKLVVIEILYLQ